MTKLAKFFIAAFVAGSAFVAVPALAADTFDFTRDGIRYVGQKSVENGSTVLRGRNTTDNTPFTLKVTNGWVRGEVGSRTVGFRVAEAARPKLGSTD